MVRGGGWKCGVVRGGELGLGCLITQGLSVLGV